MLVLYLKKTLTLLKGSFLKFVPYPYHFVCTIPLMNFYMYTVQVFILNNIISKNIEVLLFCHVCTDSPKNSYILVLNFKEFQPLSSIMGKILTPNPLIVSVLGLTLTCMYTRLLFFNIILNRALICSIFSSS